MLQPPTPTPLVLSRMDKILSMLGGGGGGGGGIIAAKDALPGRTTEMKVTSCIISEIYYRAQLKGGPQVA